MKKMIFGAISAIVLLTAAVPDKTTTIFVIGDSTAANKDTTGGKQERGWAMKLQDCFNPNYIVVDNHAVNGRSSKSFIDEGRWDKVLEKIKPGDYVIIQFGHNDEKAQPNRHTDPGSTFDYNLAKYIRETREHGGIPVLMNCVVRRNFMVKAPEIADDELLRNSTFKDGVKMIEGDSLIDTHGLYKEAPKDVARRMNCHFVDANKITHDLEQRLGREGSKKLHMWFLPGEEPSEPKGKQDNTHYNIYGATTVANLLADALCEEIPVLKKARKVGSSQTAAQVKSPKLLSDNRVEFTVKAPDALKVQIDLCGTKYDMTKGDDGIWTVKTNPQVPGFHYYSLIVDGVSVADPASQSFYGCGRWSSAIEIPEVGMDDFEVQDVPHGQVRTVYYFSKVENSWRPLMVYTPAGYDESKQQYPVVYIQHGGGEDHRGWMEQGRTAQIMDNLIAAGKAVPMIVVSANSNVRSRNGGMIGGYSWQGMQAFCSELIDNVIPFVEQNFRAIKDRKSRAMCGLSMGGGQSFYIGLRSPEVFANVGVFSTGMFGGIAGASNFDLEKEVPGMLTDTKTFNKQLDVFFVSCGEQDPRISYTRDIVKKMRDGGVDVRFNSYPGDHEWQVWRKSLHEFAQYLFTTRTR